MRDFEMAVGGAGTPQAAWRPDRARRFRHGLFPAWATSKHGWPLEEEQVDRSFLPHIETNPVSLSYRQEPSSTFRAISASHVSRRVSRRRPGAPFSKSLGCQAMQGYYFGRPCRSIRCQAVRVRAR